MISEYYSVGNRNSLQQRIANAKGKFSNQFMNGERNEENLSRRMDLEAGIRMGGYDTSINKPVPEKKGTNRYDLQQPMARCSDFWIG